LYFVVLFHKIFSNLGILCFHCSIIVNTDNGITYNGGSHEFLITTLDMSFNELFRIIWISNNYIRYALNKLSRIICDWLDWNVFEIKVEITWRMLQTEINQVCYISVPICSDKSVNSMFGFARINKINKLERYLNNWWIRSSKKIQRQV